MIFKLIFSSAIIVILTSILIINIRLEHSEATDNLAELHGIGYALMNGADRDMQKIYPEGYVFINSLYGLAWCNYIRETDPHSEIFREGLSEVHNAWERVNSPEGKKVFDENLKIPYGAFYAGWSTYLLGMKLNLESADLRDSTEIKYFSQQCKLISDEIDKRTYPVSYAGSAWPADAVLCVAALSLHDKTFPARYDSTIVRWTNKVKASLDEVGLIPHSIDPQRETKIESARGSSQSLMLIFLKEIDSVFARTQYTIYKEQFHQSRFGLMGVREYPHGNYRAGDIDSGPVLLGFGASATIVGMQTAALYGDAIECLTIRKEINAFGFPSLSDKRIHYLFGRLPIADAFIAWGHSAQHIPTVSKNTFATFHSYSAAVSGLLIFLGWYLWRKKKKTFPTLTTYS